MTRVQSKAPWDCLTAIVPDIQAVVSVTNNNNTIGLTSTGQSPFQPADSLDFALSGSEDLTLDEGLYYFTSFSLKGNSQLLINGNVIIYCAGPVMIGGNARLVSAGGPYDCALHSLTDTLTVSGNAMVSAMLYAVNGPLKIEGEAEVFGKLVADTIELSGTSTVHIDTHDIQYFLHFAVTHLYDEDGFLIGTQITIFKLVAIEIMLRAPFGINVDPWIATGQQTWEQIFDNLEWLRSNEHPLMIRVTFRAQWIQNPPICEPGQHCPLALYDEEAGYYKNIIDMNALATKQHPGIKIMAILSGTPTWNSVDGTELGVPTNHLVWVDFVNKMVNRFPGIHHWQIWNEPNSIYFWHGNSQQFAEKIHNPAVQAIRAIRPNDTIMTAGMVSRTPFWYQGFWNRWDGGGSVVDFMQRVGGQSRFNVFAMHKYSTGEASPPNWRDDIRYAMFSWREALTNHCPDCNISDTFTMYLTEYGASTVNDAHDIYTQCGCLEYFIYDQITHHDTNDDPACDRYFIFRMYDGENDVDKYGIFYEDGQKKPAAYMYKCKIHKHYIPDTSCPNYCAEP